MTCTVVPLTHIGMFLSPLEASRPKAPGAKQGPVQKWQARLLHSVTRVASIQNAERRRRLHQPNWVTQKFSVSGLGCLGDLEKKKKKMRFLPGTGDSLHKPAQDQHRTYRTNIQASAGSDQPMALLNDFILGSAPVDCMKYY